MTAPAKRPPPLRAGGRQGPRLRVVYVGPLPPMRGGSGTVAGLVLPALPPLGIDVHALAPLPPSAAPATAASAAWGDGRIRVLRYPVPTFSNLLDLGSSDPAYRDDERRGIATRLSPLLEAVRPDVLLIGRESLAWHVPDIAQAHGVPTMLLVHGGMTLAGLLAGQGAFRELRDHLDKVNLVVAVAQHIARALRGLGLRRLAVVDNPVDIELFAPHSSSRRLRRALGIADGDSVVLHASNLTRGKRPMDIVEAAAIAVRRVAGLCFVIVGEGVLRPALEERVGRLGIQQAVRFAGWVEHDRMPAYINLADIVVMPSEREGQSLVYLETQACGRVIIASDIPAAREVIAHGRTGLLFGTGDVVSLAEAIVAAARSPRLRATMGARARTTVARHATGRVATSYAALLGRLAPSGGWGRESRHPGRQARTVHLGSDA